ncbi:hypothetical protein IT570_08110 [Candidatus Sumerlaeota bacterium]|nr:hypothetical protein [Candidatus Sumerlaeota bacterium]
MCAGAALLGVITAGRLWVIWFGAPTSFLASLPDDAWYYFSIACHIASGAGSTFDGVHPTNGYHPLWMMVLSTLRLLAGDMEMMRFARLATTMQLCMGVGAAVLHSALCHRVLKSGALAGVMLAMHATPFVVYGMTDGMESGLVQLMIALLFWTAHGFRAFTEAASTRTLAFGSVVSMAVLARLDLGLLLVALLVVLVLRREWKRAVVIAFPSGIVVPLYLFMNAMHFDSVLPISAILKSTFPHFHFHAAVLREQVTPVCSGMMIIALGVLNLQRPADRDVQLLLRASVIFTALHLIHTVFFTHWGIQKWHFTAYWPLLIWQVVLVERFASGALRALVVVGVLSIAGQFAFFHARSRRAFQNQSIVAAQWAKANIPASRLIGMSDCGAFGAFRGDGVVNLDGVVNNMEYQDVLVKKGLAGYLDDAGITYLAHHAVDLARVQGRYGTYEYKAYAHSTPNNQASGIRLREADEIYRGTPFHDGTGVKVFVIWKRRRELSPRAFNGNHMP